MSRGNYEAQRVLSSVSGRKWKDREIWEPSGVLGLLLPIASSQRNRSRVVPASLGCVYRMLFTSALNLFTALSKDHSWEFDAKRFAKMPSTIDKGPPDVLANSTYKNRKRYRPIGPRLKRSRHGISLLQYLSRRSRWDSRICGKGPLSVRLPNVHHLRHNRGEQCRGCFTCRIGPCGWSGFDAWQTCCMEPSEPPHETGAATGWGRSKLDPDGCPSCGVRPLSTQRKFVTMVRASPQVSACRGLLGVRIAVPDGIKTLLSRSNKTKMTYRTFLSPFSTEHK